MLQTGAADGGSSVEAEGDCLESAAVEGNDAAAAAAIQAVAVSGDILGCDSVDSTAAGLAHEMD